MKYIPVILRKIVYTFAALAFVLFAEGQPLLRVDGTRIVDASGEEIILRGVGLGGWMLQEGYMLRKYDSGQQHVIRKSLEELVGPQKTAEFYDTWLANHTRRIDIDSMKAWGFNSVRLPIHYNLFTLPVEEEPIPGSDTWLPKGFAMTDSLLDWCKTNQMYLILDLHAAPGGQGTDMNISDRDPSKPSLWDSEANRKKTIALWRKLAERYANEEWIGGYDIINEPNWGFEDYENDKNGLNEKLNVPLKKLLVDITNAIREVDQRHIIIIEGNGWGNNYNNMLPPWDKNMVLSFHKYWNFNDEASIAHILETRKKYNVPVWLGETGENSNVWFTQCVELLERHGIGWAWWPLKKVGFNNPLEIPSNPSYDQIVQFWAGAASKPSAEVAWKGLQQLGEALKLENNIIHTDVIDALIRQPHSRKSIAFKNHRLDKDLIIRAVHYDLGRNGIAYFDLDTANYRISNGQQGGNKGHQFRNDGVDIFSEKGIADSHFVGDFHTGEWLTYSFEAAKAGTWQVALEGKAVETDAQVELLINGKRVGISALANKDASNWSFSAPQKIKIPKGKNLLTIKVISGRPDVRSVRITSR